MNGNESLQSRRVSFQLQSTTGDTKHDISEARTTSTLNVSGHKVNWSTEKLTWPHLTDLPLVAITDERVDVLLGSDAFPLIVPREV